MCDIFFSTSNQQGGEALEVVGVGVVEGVEVAAVDVEDGYHLIVPEEGDDYLAATFGAAGDVAGELLHVGHHDSAALFPSGTTYPTTVADMHTCQRSLERTEKKFSVFNSIESCPPEVEFVVEKGTDIGHLGDEVVLAVTKSGYLWQ